MCTMTFLYFGFIIIIGVVQFSTTFIIPRKNNKLAEFRFAKHDLKRFRREKCETLRYYDVTCHGLCPYTEKDWEKNKVFKNCPDGLAYHCARDNKTNEYVEACAEAVRCDRGKEPRLIFPAGHNKTARVICRYCHDEDFYNPIEFRLSSTYYECTEYKYPCSRYGIGKIRCDQDGIERHWKDNKCRCNERNMYIESNAACPIDFPCKDKTHFDFYCELYDCGKTSQGYWRNLTKDYCCACEDGYIRNETSNKCHTSSHDVSLQTMNISHHHTNITTTSTATILMSSEVKINITASTKLTTHRNIIISYIQPTATAIPSLSGGKDLICMYIIPTVALVLIFIVGIICYKRKKICKKICKKRGQDEPIDSPQSEILLRDPSSANIQNEASSAQPLTSQSTETSLSNDQNAGGSVQLQRVSSASIQDPSSANIQNEASFVQPLTSQSAETSFANNQNAGGSAQLPSDSSASVQVSSTVTTTNITGTEIIKRIKEIGDIKKQQMLAILKTLEDERTKEIADLKELRQQAESSSANDQNVPGPAHLSKTTAPVNTESEGSSADHIQNEADIIQLRSDSVCSQANNQNEAASAQLPSPAQPFINQNEDSSLPYNQNEAVSAQLPRTADPSITESEDSRFANYQNKAASAQLPRTPDPFITQSEGSDTIVSLSNCNNKR